MAANLGDQSLDTVRQIKIPPVQDFAGDTASATAEVMDILQSHSADLHEDTGALRDRAVELSAAVKTYNETFQGWLNQWTAAVDEASAVSPYDAAGAANARAKVTGIQNGMKNSRNEFVAYLTKFVSKVEREKYVKPEIIVDTTNMPPGTDVKAIVNAIEMGYASSSDTLAPGRLPKDRKIIVKWGDTIREGVPAQVSDGEDGSKVMTIRKDVTGSIDGLLLHESAHLVQDYKDTPTWVTEGMADYVREYGDGRYTEPGAHGPRTYTREQLAALPNKWESQYVPSAQFLNWAQQKNPEAVPRLHQAAQSGTYDDKLLPSLVGAKSLDDMWAQFVADQPPAQQPGILPDLGTAPAAPAPGPEAGPKSGLAVPGTPN